jgi:hypothetical protein
MNDNKVDFYNIRLLVAVAILSLAIVSYEIYLIHFFTIVQWHHFAYMVISIALLGFGASGTLISIFKSKLLKTQHTILPFLMISTGLLMTLAVRFSRTDIASFDSYTLFVDHTQYAQMVLTYFIFFLPFFSGALAIGIIFVSKVSNIGRYYFSDLTGAGIGGLVSIFLFWKLTPQEIPSIIAIFPVVSGLIILKKKTLFTLLPFALFSIILCVYHLNKPFDYSHSEFKGISYALNLPKAKVVYEKSSPYGLTQVVSSPALRYAPGLSLTYPQAISSSDVIYNNGDWYASIPMWSEKDSFHLLDYTTMALPYSFGERKNALILHSPAGLEISHALSNNVHLIEAVEPNKIVVSLMRNEYVSVTDSLFYHPNVQIHSLQARTFLALTEETYDLIQLPLLGEFGGSVGLNAVVENNLLTKEAFTEMWNKLSPDGVIVVSSWLDFPNRIPLKCAATIAECLYEYGIEVPTNHVAAVRSWGTITFVIKKSPMNESDIHSIKSFCEEYGFDPTILSGLTNEERNRYNLIEDKNFFHLMDGMFTSERENIYSEYDFIIIPATDNQPYFFQFLRWQSIFEETKGSGKTSVPFLELGYLVVGVTFIQVVLLAVLFIIIPLFNLGWKGAGKSWVFLYFCGLGFGYLSLEIVLIKHFALYLGHPIYSVALVISVMLFSSGIGSYFSSRIDAVPKTLFRITGIIVCFIFIYLLLISPLLINTIGMHTVFKIGFSVILISLPSFFMGMPFPIGLKVVAKTNENHVPWAWAINGCVSVISTVLATIIAVELGFRSVMFFAALAYLTAFLSNFLLTQKQSGSFG